MGRARRISQTFLAGLLGLAVLAGLYVLAAGQDWRWDLTRGRRHSLDPASVAVLRDLNATTRALAFFRPGDPQREHAEELLQRMAAHTQRFGYEFVDPDRDVRLAREYEAVPGSVVLLAGERSEQVPFPDEESLVNALVRVTDPGLATVYVLQGHGELDPEGSGRTGCSRLAGMLRKQGAEVRALSLALARAVPDDAGVVLVPGPRKDLLASETRLLDDYLARGGRVLVALAPEAGAGLTPEGEPVPQPELEGWLERSLGLRPRPGLVVDPTGQLLAGDSLYAVGADFGEHPVTRGFELLTLLPSAGALEPAANATAAAALVLSNDRAWLETDLDALRRGTAEFDPKTDAGGPLWLAATWRGAAGVDGGGPARAVVLADHDLLADDTVGLGGNLDLARNALHWLQEREGRIAVSRPEPASVFLFLSPAERALLTWGPLALVPGAAALAALWTVLRRRRAR
jgi:hypothetical protein